MKMLSNNKEQENIRKYLLALPIDEEIRQNIESRLLTDDDFEEELAIYEDELIDEYLGKKLTEQEALNFESHLLTSSDIQERLDFARILKTSLEKRKPAVKNQPREKTFFSWLPSFVSATPAFAALIIILIGGVAFSGWYFFFAESDLDKGLMSLRQAYAKQRPVSARIVGFVYAPLTVTRSGDSKDIADPIIHRQAELYLIDAAAEKKTAATLHGLGQLYLSEKKFDEAVEQFEKAVKLAPDDAELHSDLGAAFLEIGKKAAEENDGAKSSESFAKSLEHLETAIRLNGKLLEPRFNRALCLQEMLVPEQAIEAWQKYLQLDADSLWADEARGNLSRLENQTSQSKSRTELLRDFMEAFQSKDDATMWKIQSRNKEMITGKLIPQQLAFLFLEAEGAEKSSYLSALRHAGKIEREMSGDKYFSEIADFYSSASKEKQTILAEAQKSVQKGYELCLENKFKEALVEFERAGKLFNQVRNIWEARLCDYWIAYCLYQGDGIRKSTEILTELADFCEANQYKWLASQALYWLSINASALKRISKSIEYAEKGLRLSEEISDLYLTQKTLSWLVDKNRQVGQYRKSFSCLQKVLSLGKLPESSIRQKGRDYDFASRLFYSLKYYESAFVFGKEALKINETEIKDLSFERVAYARLSRILSSQKKYDEASEFARLSRQTSEKLNDEEARRKGIAFAVFQQAHIEQEKGDCQKALAYYDEAIGIYDSMEFDPDRYEASKGRLICYLENNDEAMIQTELPKVLQLLEENRNQILEEQNRNSFFDNEQSVYDLVIDYEYSKADFEQALNYSEISRSRSLLDMKSLGVVLSPDEANPQIVFSEEKMSKVLTFSEMQNSIPEKIQIIQYAVLRDKLVIWLITKDKIEAFSYPVAAEMIEEKTLSFLASIKNRDGKTQNELSRELYEILFRPVEDKLDANREICIIPDKSLFYLPFVALIDDQTGDYLVTRRKTFFSPSLNILLVSTENAKKHNPLSAERLLSIGNPKFDRQEFPELPFLPRAEKEALSIREFYEERTVYLGEEAKKEKLKAELSQADVVHFAGHYMVNENSPLLSGFMVAGVKEEGNLSNYEILKLNLKRPRLIVLSACETEIEGFFKGEGMIGAGRTFLASGIPLVIGTQWEVESDSTAELMQNFHRFRKQEKLSTVSALQRAQLEVLNHANKRFREPYYWAGFTALGGYAEF